MGSTWYRSPRIVYKTLALRSGFIATVLGLLYPRGSLDLGVQPIFIVYTFLS